MTCPHCEALRLIIDAQALLIKRQRAALDNGLAVLRGEGKGVKRAERRVREAMKAVEK